MSTQVVCAWLGPHDLNAADNQADEELGPIGSAYGEIYRAVDGIMSRLQLTSAQLAFHLSPGTPAMAAVWILLAGGRYKARLIEAHRVTGLREVDLPFDIMAQYRPWKGLESHISVVQDQLLPASPAFDATMHQSEGMQRAIAKAKRAAGGIEP